MSTEAARDRERAIRALLPQWFFHGCLISPSAHRGQNADLFPVHSSRTGGGADSC